MYCLYMIIIFCSVFHISHIQAYKNDIAESKEFKSDYEILGWYRLEGDHKAAQRLLAENVPVIPLFMRLKVAARFCCGRSARRIRTQKNPRAKRPGGRGCPLMQVQS